MTDQFSQNPSDSTKKPDFGDSSGNAGEQNPEKKLKLKQLLTPLSPHLIVKPREHPPKHQHDEFGSKMEIPRAEAIELEPELAPHERPPSPDGTPLPPPEAELGPGGQPLQPPQPGQVHLKPLETSKQEDSGQESAEEENQQEEVEALVSARAPKLKRFRKLALSLVAIVVVLAAVQFIFDPFGLSIEPLDQPAPVAVSAQQEAAAKEETPANLAPVTLTLELENISVESFLGQLEQQSIIASNKPKGAIIDSVFYPEGSTLNPMLGLVLDTVQLAGKDSNIQIIDESGKRYEFPAK